MSPEEREFRLKCIEVAAKVAEKVDFTCNKGDDYMDIICSAVYEWATQTGDYLPKDKTAVTEPTISSPHNNKEYETDL